MAEGPSLPPTPYPRRRQQRSEAVLKTLTALLYSMTIDRALAGIRTRVPEFCGMKAGDRVLDVCCGTGAQAFYFARRGIISWGIDLDSGMIGFAERRKRRLNVSNTSFLRGSATHLPFRDACFDHASISMGLHEKKGTSRDRIVSEMRRVVKKDGTLAIVDYRVPYPMDAHGRAVRLLEQMAGRDHYRCFQEFISDGGLGSLLRRHGLKEDKSEHVGRVPISILKVRNG
jgi:ubiquinone/menaquinone biosynthesis C-methylase UbiE